VMVNSGQY